MIRLVKYVANIMISDVMIERCDAEEEYWLFLNQFLGMLLLVSGKNNELFPLRATVHSTINDGNCLGFSSASNHCPDPFPITDIIIPLENAPLPLVSSFEHTFKRRNF